MTTTADWAAVASRPSRCKIESFSREDLLSIPNGEKEKHIYVVGTSVMRGVFQGLIDLWLPQEDKANFMPSIVHRCWGRADLKKGNLRLTYQDLRISAMEAPEEVGKNHIECHNGKVAKEDGEFLKSAYALWEEIFHDPSKWPDVIFFGSGYRWTDKHDFETHTLWFAKNLPPAWKGTIVFSGGEFHGGLAGLGSLEKYNQYRAEIRQMLAAMNDPRVRWLDGMGVSSNHRLYTEIGPKSISGSAHFHDRSYKPVYEPSGEIVSKIRFKSQMVVSNVTDIVGQILLGHALGPKEQFLKQVEAANSHGIGEKAELETCTHCPKSLMPFRLIPYPELRCSTGPIQRYDPLLDEVEERPVRDCPRYCMRQEPEWSFPSQSDTVYVRQCAARPSSELQQQRRRAKG